MKRILTLVALMGTLVTLTGCGGKKTLNCSMSSTDNEFTTTVEAKYDFKNDRISKVNQTSTVVVEGDFAQTFDEYKKSAEQLVEEYNNKKGYKAKLETDNNKVSVTIEMTPSEMSDDDYKELHMGENYDSMKSILTEDGYTCK